MWSYYGSKGQIADLYPPPIEPKIIEPFAGSAKYALRYWQREVLLIDKYPVIVNLWKWLQQCSPNDILKLPRKMESGDRVSNYKYDHEQCKILMGFLVGRAVQAPRDKIADRNAIMRPNNLNFYLKKIAGDLHKIKHWKIELGSYEDLPNEKATWFIDPPYQFGGHVYPMSNKFIDYPALAKWSAERKGQIIVCENTKADWMDFKPMKRQRGSSGTTTEAIWSNLPTAYDSQQLSLL
jgi:16S rRNA G966 N2-methylase RsmD